MPPHLKGCPPRLDDPSPHFHYDGKAIRTPPAAIRGLGAECAAAIGSIAQEFDVTTLEDVLRCALQDW